MSVAAGASGTALVWFRRDLRDHDHAALYHALKTHAQVFCAFVFDTTILDELPRDDHRVAFLHACVVDLAEALHKQGGHLIVRCGPAREVIPQLALELGVSAVYANEDYEPDALHRDDAVSGALGTAGIALRLFKDQVIFARDELLTAGRTPYGVFTPYKNAWLKALTPYQLKAYPVEGYCRALARGQSEVPALAALGFSAVATPLAPGMAGARALWQDFRERMVQYRQARDFPAVKGVSYLSAHLRFGTISIRELARVAYAATNEGAQTWLSELIWRDFYFQVLWHRPDVVSQSFRREFDRVEWEQGPAADQLFEAWCAGRTGYPIVDAAMRQLNQSGYMHNRLRMIVASFLSKDLGIHWLRGERYFAAQLYDFDLAANNGGWQWAASTGCDAQPWFRIFNPVTQSARFDPDGKFIRRYVPELAAVSSRAIHAPWLMSPLEQQATRCVIGRDYPAPIVDHAAARELTLARFKAVRPTPG